MNSKERNMAPAPMLAAVPERLIGVEELADLLGVPAKTIYDWEHRKVGPPSYKIGRYLRFRPSEVHAWVESKAS